MTFTPPAFVKLRINTLNLDVKYSTLLGRYKVVDEQVMEGTSVQQTSLDVLIARTNEVIKCKTDRETQREVFNILVNELRQIPKDDGEKVKQGTLFLLGALIHRYFRLINEYSAYNGYASWTFFATCTVTDCKLFQAIRKALQFRDLEIVRKKYQEDDLKVIDVVTIVRSLEAFRDNMLLEDEKRVPRYMKYPHFVQDKNFKQHLQEIITLQTERGSALLQRFKAIAFLQSLAKEIEKEKQQIDMDIQKWCKAVAREYKEFNAFRGLSDDIINDSITKSIESETSRNVIFNLFYTPLIQDNLASTDHTTLVDKMKECYEHKCSYMLFGGYALLLRLGKGLDRDLLFSFQKALELEKPINDLTKEELLNGVKFLKQFIDMEPGVALNCEFFGGKEKMFTGLARVEKELTEQVAASKAKDESLALTF